MSLLFSLMRDLNHDQILYTKNNQASFKHNIVIVC